MMFPELRGRKSRGACGNPEPTGNTEAGVDFQFPEGTRRKKQAPFFFFYAHKISVYTNEQKSKKTKSCCTGLR
jgi:hypothetical protein